MRNHKGQASVGGYEASARRGRIRRLFVWFVVCVGGFVSFFLLSFFPSLIPFFSSFLLYFLPFFFLSFLPSFFLYFLPSFLPSFWVCFFVWLVCCCTIYTPSTQFPLRFDVQAAARAFRASPREALDAAGLQSLDILLETTLGSVVVGLWFLSMESAPIPGLPASGVR